MKNSTGVLTYIIIDFMLAGVKAAPAEGYIEFSYDDFYAVSIHYILLLNCVSVCIIVLNTEHEA